MLPTSTPATMATEYELSQSAGWDKETEDSDAPSEPLCWSWNCVNNEIFADNICVITWCWLAEVDDYWPTNLWVHI